ncbi:MAG: hypothetical protein WC551_07370 [Patescibacteria group bacterium]
MGRAIIAKGKSYAIKGMRSRGFKAFVCLKLASSVVLAAVGYAVSR